MILNLLFVFLFSTFSKSQFFENHFYPFTKTVDFGTPSNLFLLSLSAAHKNYEIDSFSCDRIAVTVFEKDVYDSFEVVYYFYNGHKEDRGVLISGLYQITVDYRNNLDLTLDDKIDEYYALEFADILSVEVKKKNGKIVENREILNDRQNPKNGIVNLDGTWWVFDKNGNVVSLRFPSREHIKQGQKSRIMFKQKFSIDWSCD